MNLLERRRNSIKKVDIIIADLAKLNENELDITQNKGLILALQKHSDIIIEGLKLIKMHIEDKLSREGFSTVARPQDIESNRINQESEVDDDISEDEKEAEKQIVRNLPENQLGYVIPLR